jgi:hypothetical protein
MTTDIDHRRERRALRLRVARLRRRIDRRTRSLEREGRRLVSWQTYVRRFPASALLAAFGIGLAASAGPRAGWSRMLGLQLARRAGDKAVGGLIRELKAIWDESNPDETGAERGRS